MSDAPANQHTAAPAPASRSTTTPTPTPAPTPVPNTAPSATSPSPLLIGKAFIKQYYQVLSTNPAQITKFYKPNSLISHSLLPSVPGITKTLREYQDHASNAKDKANANANANANTLFAWCRPEKGDKLCFDFGRGAIDAQGTINGGILLVVTGHIRLPCWKADGEDDGMKRFVHTFFLNNGAPAGKKRQFYVHNDVLRFLDQGVDLDLDLDLDSTIIQNDDKKKDAVEQQDEHVSESEKEGGEVTVPPVQNEEVASAAVVVANKEDTPATKEDSNTSEGDAKETAVDIVDESKEGEKENGTAAAVANAAIVVESKVVDVINAAERVKDSTAGSAAHTSVAVEGGKKDKSTETAEKDADTKKVAKETASKPTKSVENKGKTEATTLQEKKPRKNKSRGRARKSRSSSPTEGSTSTSSKGKKATAGSWASLVAGGSGPSAVAAAAADAAAEISKDEKQNSAPPSTVTNAKKSSNSSAKKESTSEQEKMKGEQASSDQQSQPQQQQQQQQNQQQQQPLLSKKAAAAQRTPEATVLIKNIPDRTKEPEIRAMFEPYASKFQKRILGITLLANRGFCFVDFDSKDVVDDIVKDVEAEKEAKAEIKKTGGDATVSKFTINRRALEVGRKVPADKAATGGRGRGPRRSSSPSRGGGYKNNRGGGRRNSPRGGNRSGNKK